MTIIAIMLACLLGGSIVALLWPRERALRADLTIIAPLGAIVGLFATSVLFFAASLVSERPALLAACVDIVATTVLVWRAGQRWKTETQSLGRVFTFLEWVLAVALLQVAVVAGVVAWRSFSAEPLGGWDGWAIWNMHARFMLRAGTHWPELLSAPQLSWTHPDYPRLVSASVARLWAWAGQEAPWMSGLVSVLFAAATVALLLGAISRVRCRAVAFVSGIMILGTPFFVTFAASQHADIPLGSLMLAAVVLVVIASHVGGGNSAWGLAGICAGGAAWTKNEGLLFAVVLAAVVALHLTRTKAPPAARRFFAALGVALITVVYFKLQLAPANDLMSSPVGARVEQLWDWARHRTILTVLWRDLGRFGEWSVAPWLFLGLPFLAWRSRRLRGAGEWMIACVIGLMTLGYYIVYLASPQDLSWHLDSSLVRLLLQLWPLTILAWGLAVPSFAGWPWQRPCVGRWISTRWFFVAVNVLLATGSIGALTLQRGANELAVGRFGGTEVSVALDEGWFPLERDGRNEWAWSSGRAQLRVNVSGGAGRTVTLRFAMAGASARTVTIRQGAHELWTGAIANQHVPVRIAGLVLAPGATTIEFTTDTAGLNEAPAAGGRALAFAIFNLTLE